MQSAQFQLHADIEDRHWWFVARREILGRVIRAVVPPVQGATVIDVGCGTGANLASLAGDYHCVGVDTSDDAIEHARRRFSGVEFRQGFAPQAIADVLPQASLVMLADVLEHVPDDFELFSSLLAAAPVGCYFLLTVPAELALWSRHDESFGHYRRYDRERLERLWADLPVEPLVLSHYNSRLYPVVKFVRWWNRRQGQAAGAAGTDFHLPPRPVNRLLERVLATESQRLLPAASGLPTNPYARGVSLMALLRRGSGEVAIQRRPAELANFFDPQAAFATAGF